MDFRRCQYLKIANSRKTNKLKSFLRTKKQARFNSKITNVYFYLQLFLLTTKCKTNQVFQSSSASKIALNENGVKA